MQYIDIYRSFTKEWVHPYYFWNEAGFFYNSIGLIKFTQFHIAKNSPSQSRHSCYISSLNKMASLKQIWSLSVMVFLNENWNPRQNSIPYHKQKDFVHK